MATYYHSTDIDECTAGIANCAVEATCMNTDGSYTCACNTGYAGDGVTCSSKLNCMGETGIFL